MTGVPAGQEFPAAPADRVARWSWVLLAAVALAVVAATGTLSVLVLTAVLVPVLADAARRPVGYVLSDGTLVVRRTLAPALRYELAGPVERSDPETLRGLWFRRAVPGAYVGAQGAAADGGRVRYHLTDRDRAVRAEIADGAVLVSPRDPDAFVLAARQR